MKRKTKKKSAAKRYWAALAQDGDYYMMPGLTKKEAASNLYLGDRLVRVEVRIV